MTLRDRIRATFSRGSSNDVRERLDRQHARLAGIERELARVLPQVAALEERMEDLRQRLENGTPPVDGAAVPEEPATRALWEEIQRQHEQVRIRISGAARFEERLRQVEEQVGQLSR